MKAFYHQLFAGFVLIAIFSLNGFGQVMKPGQPPSMLDQSIDKVFEVREFPQPDMEPLLLEDRENEELGFPSPPRMGISFPVEMNTGNAGTWTTLADGGRLWRLKIVCEGALALGMNFDSFYIPDGGELYFYNENSSMISGAFTHESNTPFGVFSSDFIQGDKLIIEYYEAPGTDDEHHFSMNEVVYAYRDIWFNFEPVEERGGAWWCMINVACEEGDDWQAQSAGATKLSIKIGMYWYWCSGSLINTTQNDRSPYVLTAAHCGEGASTNDLLYWKFYFNNEASYCAGNYGPTSDFRSGCTFKAKDPSYADAGSDFYLVLLNQPIPATYNAFYNGWNRTNIPAADTGVGIHHPAGDIKKISTHWHMVSSSWWNGLPTHWRIQWAQTANGKSIMQGGSSGSPVFDEDGYIMGDLTGGYASNSCTNPSPAWYGKIWYSWDQNGLTPSTRLKDWLDPINTGTLKHPGIYHAVMPPIVDFVADTTYITQGDSVQFTDLTTGNPASSWMWVFEGGSPDTSYIKNPKVHYCNSYGLFDVSLTVTNPDGSDTEVKPDYIEVAQALPPDADFEADQLVITEGDRIDFTDLSTSNPTSWEWIFEGGLPDTSWDQNPEEILYSNPGEYDVTLTAINCGGSDTEIKIDYITVNPGILPIADFVADVTQIMVGDTVHYTDLSTGDPTKWTWTFEGGSPGGSSQHQPSGIVYNEEGTFYSKLWVKNAYGNNTMLKEDYIVVGGVSVSEINSNKGILVYPNPSEGIVNLRLLDVEAENITILIFNTQGHKIDEIKANQHIDRVILDLSNQPCGLYYLTIKAGGKTIHRKVSLVK